MADEIIDSLRIKIEKAKRQLPLETVNAIDAVDWRLAILELRTKKGYTFEQLGDLELETELLLCGLISPKDYPNELEKRMGISRSTANELANDMNNNVFKKIKEELIKNTERKKIFNKENSPLGESENTPTPSSKPAISKESNSAQTLNSTGVEIVPEKLELKKPEITDIISAQKLSGPMQIGIVKTNHSLSNITKTNTQNTSDTIPKAPNSVDPYREMPE